MNTYKISGFINSVAGPLTAIYSLLNTFVITPRLLDMYKDMGVTPPDRTLGYISMSYGIGAIVLIYSLIQSYIGIKVIQNKDEKNQVFGTASFILMVITLIFGGLAVAGWTLSIILPIYKLTQSF